MKKVVLLSLFTLCFPILLSAQNYDDDLYYVPDKNKGTGKSIKKEVKTTTVYTIPETTVVVRDRKTKKVRDVDEYNRRYDASDYKFELEDDTLYVEEKSASDLDGEWMNGFDGSQDDYEYAERIIRFRNPRYAVHISSPLYWDVVYGLNSWDWNVYTDGWYAYAFPTFSNRLWWDWRFNSHGWGWGGYYDSYYSWGYPGSWGGGYWGNYSPYYYSYYPHYYGGWGHGYSGYWTGNVYHNDRQSVYNSNRINTGSSISSRRSTAYSGSSLRRNESGANTRQQNYTPGTQTRRSSSSARVVGTRRDAVNERQNTTTRPNASSSRTTTYTRPSSTRSTGTVESNRSTNVRSEGTYTRGSSTTSSSRRSSSESSNSSNNNNNSSSRQSSNSSSVNSSRSSNYSSGSSSSSSSSRSSSGVSS
ncbi:hypothetical protein EZS27_028400, partial [termite gut metagenome]